MNRLWTYAGLALSLAEKVTFAMIRGRSTARTGLWRLLPDIASLPWNSLVQIGIVSTLLSALLGGI